MCQAQGGSLRLQSVHTVSGLDARPQTAVVPFEQLPGVSPPHTPALSYDADRQRQLSLLKEHARRSSINW